MAPSARKQQLVDAPLGRHFTSPKKRNRHATQSGRERVPPLGRGARLDELQTRLQSLFQSGSKPAAAPSGYSNGDVSESIAPSQVCE